jgi:hypothetical protein
MQKPTTDPLEGFFCHVIMQLQIRSTKNKHLHQITKGVAQIRFFALQLPDKELLAKCATACMVVDLDD